MSTSRILGMGLLALFLSLPLAILSDYSILQSALVSYIIFASIFCVIVIKTGWLQRSDEDQEEEEEAHDWGIYSRKHNMLSRRYERTFHAPKTKKRNVLENDMSINSVAERAFAQWSQLSADEPQASGERVFFASTNNSAALDNLEAELIRSGHHIDICNDLDEVLSCITEAPEKWKYLFVDIDQLEQFTPIENIIDFLMCFRNEVPYMPIALVSEYFEKDDLGTTRIHATDVSLRAPVSKGRAENALFMMTINNKLWQAQDNRSAEEQTARQHREASN